MIVQTTFNPMPSVATEARANPPDTAKQQAPAPEQAPPAAEPSRKEVDAAVESANHAPNVAAHNLKFRVDEQSDRVVIKVVDKETGETVREIPPEEMLAIADSIERYQKGLLLSQEA
jgi:flagellar protein FlaG